ncbi:ATP-binding cassette, subfamily B [Ignavigranum ruoffiae]|uniref:ATP-binding cassette, subfamily B n=1 Tax=Ignavigranum ruoffiae TaxID=89093 RepID=A0A1H8ZT92_9LACT|nr:ABC transporter ATP-binding protein [Ignavigranum ruoffiae]SEP67501.1 ATP-binding cassette, subfamily B [Ignavigranum ruoffiae]
MRNLWQQLKPYRWLILLIMLFHVGRAYTTLLLPDYTSRLIDIGIQNSGFEYAVPLEITAQDAQRLSEMMTPAEQEVLASNYQQTDHQTLRLNDQIAKDDQALKDLEKSLLEPIAVLEFLNKSSGTETSSSFGNMNPQMLSQIPKTQLRSMFKKQIEKMDQNMLRSAAVNFVKDQYEASGNDLQAYQWQYLFREGGQMLMITLASILVAVGAHFFASRISADLGYNLREQIYRKVLSFSHYEIDRFSTSSLITRSTNDIQQISTTMTVILRFALFAPVMAAGGIYHVIRTGTSLSWIIVLAVLAVVIIVGGLLVLTMPKFKIMQKQVDGLNLVAREILTGLQVIRSFGRQELETQRFDTANSDLKRTMLFVNRTMSMMMPLMMLIMNATSILIVWVAGHQIASGGIMVGQMTAFISYTMQIIFSFMIFSMMAVLLPRAVVSSDRVAEVIDSPIQIHDADQVQHIDQAHGQVEFNQVSFRYPGAKQDSISQVSFRAEPGKTTAIIGSTGSGKSTLLSLLLRFYEVSQGSITIDGVDIRQLSQHDLRDLIGYVPQKGVLFSGSVSSNIKYSDDQIADPQMVQAANIAAADEFIQEMDGEYQASISQGGANVSGGQKQRLSIARAIAKDPTIYLFDDSFSALDYKTDAQVRRSLELVTKEATVIIVAQRVSTILDADNIIVLEEGKVIGQGTHQTLMTTCPVYQEIAQSQLSAAEIERSMKGGN